MTKAEIREQIAKRKKTLTAQHLKTLSVAIVEKLQTLESFRAARTIGAYMPLADEVDTTSLFRALEKTFFIPAVDKVSGSYRMARLTPELKKGRFGILEPVVPVFATEDALDLILVPGVAFDRAGRRIGRGGGFYDRLLPQYRAGRVGLCFDFQCLEDIPTEQHDIQMNWLVTETRILKFEMNS